VNLLKLDLRIFRRVRFALAWRTEPVLLVIRDPERFVQRRRGEEKIELKREFVGGQERTVWNPSRSIPAMEFEFAETEIV
jgi:hypothetical protein